MLLWVIECEVISCYPVCGGCTWRSSGVLLGHAERTLDVAAIGIVPLLVEYLRVEVVVVEGDCDHQGDPVAPVVLGAEAVR